MKLSRLNEWLALVGNLGVIAGIIFLAVELRQNTDMTRAQTRDSMTGKQMDFYQLLISDPNVANYYVNFSTFADQNQRDPTYVQYQWLLRSQFRMWENEWYQYQQGLFEEFEFEPRMNLWRAILANEEYRSLWRIWKNQHSPDFVVEIDRLIQEIENN